MLKYISILFLGVLTITGEPAPAFSLENVDGQSVALADFSGQVVYLSFWASWCQPCIKGFKNSEAIRIKLNKQGVVLINIGIDKDPAKWKKTMERIPMPGLNLYGGQDNQLKIDYELSKLPAYYIVNKKGEFAYLSDRTDRDIYAEFRALQEE